MLCHSRQRVRVDPLQIIEKDDHRMIRLADSLQETDHHLVKPGAGQGLHRPVRPGAAGR